MLILLLALWGVTDTLNLPSPASAIFCDSDLGYLALSGDEILIRNMEKDNWQRFPLSGQFTLVQRILERNLLCYIVEGRTLILCDLRSARQSVVAEGVDDAVITSYGELWVLSEFTLRKLSPLGRELETRNLKTAPASLWLKDDSLILAGKNDPPPIPDEIAGELLEAEIILDKLSSSRSLVAYCDKNLYILIDSKRVLWVH